MTAPAVDMIASQPHESGARRTPGAQACGCSSCRRSCCSARCWPPTSARLELRNQCALGLRGLAEAGHLPGLVLAAVNTWLLLTSSFTMVERSRAP